MINGKNLNPKPSPLVFDDTHFVCQCLDGDGGAYVDLHIDSIPLEEGDDDYSEDPEILRSLALWLYRAADWMERNQ